MARRVGSKVGKGPGLLVRTALRYGMTRGVLGGSRGWLYVGGAAWLWKRVAHRKREGAALVFSEELGVDERVEIRVVPPPPTRRQARRAAR